MADNLAHIYESGFETNPSVMLLEKKNFPDKKFPAKYIPKDGNYSFNPNKVVEFYKDHRNFSRTIFCQGVPNDITDYQHIFGNGPVFMFIEGFNSDSKGQAEISVDINPELGFLAIPDLKDFPVNDLKVVTISKFDNRDLFDLMESIFKNGVASKKDSPTIIDA